MDTLQLKDNQHYIYVDIICITNKSNYIKLSSIHMFHKPTFILSGPNSTTEDFINSLSLNSGIPLDSFVYKNSKSPVKNGLESIFLIINFPDYKIDEYVVYDEEDKHYYIDLNFFDTFEQL